MTKHDTTSAQPLVAANGENYDYIIVGAGSAGCVMANRLSTDPTCRVLLLEAGGDDDLPFIRMPATFLALQDTAVDWGYRTKPQSHLNGRRIFSPRGKVLGGSSSINFMMYLRGNPRDFDGWQALGSAGWSYADVLPYFKKSEGNRKFNDEFHGSEGPLTVSSYEQPHPYGALYLAAAHGLGLPLNPDFNGAQQAGCGYYQATIRDGERCSSATAFLHPVRARPNLTVQTHALTTRIVIEGTRATGVQYLRTGTMHQAYAGAEVILCGGAFNSPQLLMLSGLGPAADLEKMGIQVHANLAGVGHNLQDHMGVSVSSEVTEPISMGAYSPSVMKAAMAQYQKDKTGLLASNLLEAGAFICADTQHDWPELQCFFHTNQMGPYPEAGPRTRPGIALTTYVNRPRSRGRVKLGSADPLDRPVIDPNYLSDPEDMRLAVIGVRHSLQVLAHAAFGGVRVKTEQGLSAQDDDATLQAYVRERAQTTWHVSGTCKMGTDVMAVVDPKLRVHGIQGLRVADVSVMPNVVSGNTNAAVIMIAEKAADMVMAAR